MGTGTTARSSLQPKTPETLHVKSVSRLVGCMVQCRGHFTQQMASMPYSLNCGPAYARYAYMTLTLLTCHRVRI